MPRTRPVDCRLMILSLRWSVSRLRLEVSQSYSFYFVFMRDCSSTNSLLGMTDSLLLLWYALLLTPNLPWWVSSIDTAVNSSSPVHWTSFFSRVCLKSSLRWHWLHICQVLNNYFVVAKLGMGKDIWTLPFENLTQTLKVRKHHIFVALYLGSRPGGSAQLAEMFVYFRSCILPKYSTWSPRCSLSFRSYSSIFESSTHQRSVVLPLAWASSQSASVSPTRLLWSSNAHPSHFSGMDGRENMLDIVST